MSISFDGRGHDFLSPKSILNDVHNFSSGIRPITSNNFVSDPFGKNPQSTTILNTTDSSIDRILSANFGQNLFAAAQPTTGGPFIVTSPTAGVAIPSGFIASNTTVYTQVYQTPSDAFIRDLGNFNPNIWSNPSASNVLLGTMDAQNKIFGGNGLFQSPMFNNFPLYPYISPNIPPYGQYSIPLPGQTPISTFQQASLFPATFESGAPAWITHVQPYAISTSHTIGAYQTQVGLMDFMLSQLAMF